MAREAALWLLAVACSRDGLWLPDAPQVGLQSEGFAEDETHVWSVAGDRAWRGDLEAHRWVDHGVVPGQPPHRVSRFEGHLLLVGHDGSVAEWVADQWSPAPPPPPGSRSLGVDAGSVWVSAGPGVHRWTRSDGWTAVGEVGPELDATTTAAGGGRLAIWRVDGTGAALWQGSGPPQELHLPDGVSPRVNPALRWTDAGHLVVVGGQEPRGDSAWRADGAEWDPTTERWTAVPTIGPCVGERVLALGDGVAACSRRIYARWAGDTWTAVDGGASDAFELSPDRRSLLLYEPDALVVVTAEGVRRGPPPAGSASTRWVWTGRVAVQIGAVVTDSSPRCGAAVAGMPLCDEEGPRLVSASPRVLTWTPP